jgi:hypothetical protein
VGAKQQSNRHAYSSRDVEGKALGGQRLIHTAHDQGGDYQHSDLDGEAERGPKTHLGLRYVMSRGIQRQVRGSLSNVLVVLFLSTHFNKVSFPGGFKVVEDAQLSMVVSHHKLLGFRGPVRSYNLTTIPHFAHFIGSRR